MFDKKKDTLVSKKTVSGLGVVTPKSAFVDAGMKKSARTLSGNGAEKFSTTRRAFVDEFGTASRFRAPRTFADITTSMTTLWAESKLQALKFLFYLRLITRKVQFPDGSTTDEVQRGQGLKHEGIFRMMWLAINYPNTFWKNIGLFISVGSWQDIITMLSYDLQYNGWKDKKLNWDQMGKLIIAGLENPKTTNLVKKYLPQIKANSAAKTLAAQADNIIAKWLCSLLFGGKADSNTSGNYKKYRKLKTSGTAHEWQKLISQRNLLSINFDTIHGRALALLVGGKFLKKNKLEEKYGKWIQSKPTAKFTGYVYELAQNLTARTETYQKDTINAQFMQLVNTAKAKLDEQGFRPISAVDTSSSMLSPMYIGSGQVGKMRSAQVAFSSAIFFDEMMNAGSPFKNVYLEFNSRTEMKKFTGSNFVEKFLNCRMNGGGTNFESVFQFFADFRRLNPKVSENEIPNFVIAFSDGEFNRASGTTLKTNIERGREILRKAGYSKSFSENFGLGLVDLPNTFYSRKPVPKFETYGDVKNVFYFSGHDLSPLSFLFGGSAKGLPTTAEELFEAAMDQEVLNLLEI